MSEGSAAIFGVIAQRGLRLAMRDGTRLATDLYFPGRDGAVVPGRHPVLLERTPYSRQIASSVAAARFFARHGYVVALQDVRGRYDSEGEWYPFAREENDGFDTVEWLGTQEWSNGKVGTMGLSYSGSDQHALATLAPPHLSAMFVSQGMSNYHTGSMRQGGAVELRFLIYAMRMAIDSPKALANPALRAAVTREWENVRDWLRATPLKPGVSVLRHFPSIEQWVLDIVRHGDYDDYWKQRGYNVEEYYEEHSDVPICLLTGWYDSYSRASATNYEELAGRKKGPVSLVIGPWVHGEAAMADTFSGEVDFGIEAPLDYNLDRLRFFDQAMRGLDTGWQQEPPVRIFVMGGGSGRKLPSGKLDHGGQWRAEAEWPLRRAVNTPHYLCPDGGLRQDPPSIPRSATTYRYDPANPVPTIGGNISVAPTVMPPGGFDQRARPGVMGCADSLPLNARHDVLTFQTEPLPEAVEITGPVEVHLWISSSAVDTDFTAKLIDVLPENADYPDGFALNLSDSIVRARYRDDRTKGTPLTPGEVYPVTISLYPISNVFGAGHRIRVDLSSSNFPRFDVNPNTGEPLGINGRSVVADNTIHHDADHPSHIVLPIVPA